MTGYSVSTQETDPKKLATAIQALYQGRTNAAGVVTLAVSAASTVVNAPTCTPSCAVLLFPKTADAAAELKNGTIYVSAVGMKSFTITHANNAQVDRTFSYVVLG
jgi:hypothetical protein